MKADEGSRGGKAGICMFVYGPGGASVELGHSLPHDRSVGERRRDMSEKELFVTSARDPLME